MTAKSIVSKSALLSQLASLGDDGELEQFLREMLRPELRDLDIAIEFVASSGGGGDFAVYRSDPQDDWLSDDYAGYHAVRGTQNILWHGRKIDEPLARGLFPEFRNLTYRR